MRKIVLIVLALFLPLALCAGETSAVPLPRPTEFSVPAGAPVYVQLTPPMSAPPLRTASQDPPLAVTAAEVIAVPVTSIWTILAGEGLWGAVFLGILGVVWTITRPFILEWTRQRKLDKLFLAAESGAAGCKQLYADELKRANSDGKLTREEQRFIFEKCREYVIAFLKTQGIDAIKEYGGVVVNLIIEYMLFRLKLGNPVVEKAAKAVIGPLPGSGG